MNPIGTLKSSNFVMRHPANPVLSAKDIPYPAALVFNAGVTKYRGRYVMVFRNDYCSGKARRLDGTNLGLAYSNDGIQWEVSLKPCFTLEDAEIRRAYDPRLTVIDGRCYMCFAVDTNHGIRGGIAVTDDFESFEILSLSVPDNRNMVLFPEKIGGRYARLERPFPGCSIAGEAKTDLTSGSPIPTICGTGATPDWCSEWSRFHSPVTKSGQRRRP